eukprot:TRINITY_DN11217_c0_g1_i1.p1 TRINITY_DN11217_c0_g1~~TRINITY_DN11217_c0_g1_i1.p1  ORF type:complete len:435 (+),score=171.25 TRINITY_DN11217_c0_g1_i1:48-1352(+)
MSFRDLRSLTEMMRSLGYPRLISLENFRQPNFPLVAEMLVWLVKRFEPTADLPTDVDSEQDRVILIRTVVQFMATKAHIKLNPKKLYQSDGYAVKELIKVAGVLYSAMKTNTRAKDDEGEGDSSTLPTFDIGSKLAELKQTRQLGTSITMKGAALYDLLGREVELREKRQAVLARNLEIQEVEAGLRDAAKNVGEETQKVQNNIENVAANEANLEAKLEKKKIELERNQKRLGTLKKVRPAFMDEYEKLEADLKKCYEEYMVRFRCLAFLEQQVEEFERTEQDRMEERQVATRKILEKMKQDENLRSFEGSSGVLSDGEELDDTDDDDDEALSPIDGDDMIPNEDGQNPQKPAKSARGSRPSGPTNTRRVYGNMTGLEDEDSLDSDSDMLLDGDTGDSEDDEELEVNEMAAESLKNRKSAKLAKVIDNNSDDDF